MTPASVPGTATPVELAPGALLEIPPEIDTPALVVDLDRLRVNLDAMAAHARSAGVDLYPHVKTHRTLQYAQMQLDSGAKGLTVAKLSEAEVFIDGGFRELLMAYPLAGGQKIRHALALTERAHLRLTVDSLAAAAEVSSAFAAAGRSAEVMLKIDSGLHRAGVLPEDAPAFVRALAGLPGIRFRGSLTHEGHVSQIGDRARREQAAVGIGEMMAGLAVELEAAGTPAEIVSVGATPSAMFATRPGVTESRPGIYAFNDASQVNLGVVGMERCAARVVATVVSHAAPDRALIDAGAKSLGMDRLSAWNDGDAGLHGLVCGHPGWDLYRLSEEHGWLRWVGDGAPSPLAIGERVQVLPVHICAAFHVLGESVAVEAGRVIGRWAGVARGSSQ
jgi:D-serine deaminase-like pyridoxal phosphate-dependent protein